MPRRSNLFQDVVAILQRHVVGDASVEESALLPNRLTGELREVDVVIRTSAGDYPLTVAVEARSAARRADVSWVEAMLKKHEDLATDKLVLVSQRGFTDQARRRAEADGAIALEPSDLDDDASEGRVATRLRSLWPKLLSLTPTTVQVTVVADEGETAVETAPDTGLYLDDGTELGQLHAWLLATLKSEHNFKSISEKIGLAKIAEDLDAYFSLDLESPTVGVGGERCTLHLRHAETGELHRVANVHVLGRAHIEVREAPLTYKRLGEAKYAYGQYEMAGRHNVLVISGESDATKVTIRWRRLDKDQTAEGRSE
jgi:hypothetical protein